MATSTSTSVGNQTGNTSQPPIDAVKVSNVEVLPQETKPSDSTPIEGKRKPSRPPSVVWEHFIKLQDDPKNPQAKCKYCNKIYACGSKKNGTSNLLSHLANQCKEYPGRDNKKQKTLSFQPKKGEEEGKLIATSYSPEACREAVVKFVILDEQPFRVVEGEGFKDMLHVCEPRFQVPSRFTIARDVLNLYKKEKIRLKNYLAGNHQRVSLTTDTWSSRQNLNYMCLTAHYIDNEWRLQKKILNFCTIVNHKGDTIGRAIETCLLEWEIEKVLTMTVDNASSNDLAVAYLSKKVNDWNGSILNGENMHMRCSAHILNLIVKEGLEDYHESITRIRNVVKYVKSSPARSQKFKACAERVKISSHKGLCLDVQTRWNSTYLMLEVAEKYQKAFECLEEQDTQYVREFCMDENKKAPTSLDWNYARGFIKFLKVFYDATLEFSGTLYVTSNLFLKQLCVVHAQLQRWSQSKDVFLKLVAENMQKKYDKYWGSYQKMNIYLFVAALLDPRFKERYLQYCFALLCGEEKASEMTSKVKSKLHELYDQYKLLYNNSATHNMDETINPNEMEIDNNEVDFATVFTTGFMKLVEETDGVESKTELDRYFIETCENPKNDNFDLLGWWKMNSEKYKILSCIARDVLAIPLSTVASESTFSTGGRILDPYRSSLSPRTVEALICTQNWLRSSPKTDIFEITDDIEDIESEILGPTSKLTLNEN